MLTTQGLWRDAILFETESGGGAATDNASEPTAPSGAIPTAAELAAELERTRVALAAANKEAQQRRLKLEAIEKADQERKDQELSEAQKAAKRAQEAEERYATLEAKHRDAAIKNAVKVAAMAAGFVDADDAVKLADLSAVELGDDEKVIGAKEAVEKLAKAKPHLLAPVRPTAPNINAQSGGNPPPVTVDAVIEQKRQSGQYVPF